jgi:hypothetical protein
MTMATSTILYLPIGRVAGTVKRNTSRGSIVSTRHKRTLLAIDTDVSTGYLQSCQ